MKYALSFFESQFAMDPQPAELNWDELISLFDSFKEGDFDKTKEMHFSGVQFKEGGQRNNAGIDSIHILVLDYDDGMSIEEAKKHFKDYQHIGYTSYNHQFDKHGDGHVVDKFRILLPLSKPCPFEDWLEIRNYLSTFAPDVDQASARPHQPYAVPISRPNAPNEIWTNDGKTVDWTTWERIEREDGYTSAAPSPPSEHKLHPDDVIRTKKGNIRIGDVTNRVGGVYCPFHNDKSPGEFVNKSDKGNIFLRCHRCGTIYMEKEEPSYIDTFLAERRSVRQSELPENEDEEGEDEDQQYEIFSETNPDEAIVEFDNELAVEPFPREARAKLLIKKYKSSEKRILLYASEGFGKSYLASILAKGEQKESNELLEELECQTESKSNQKKVLFACKSNMQAQEQAEGFLDQGLRVQMICSREHWLRVNHNVEVVSKEKSHPWDTESMNEKQTQKKMRKMGMSDEYIAELWERYEAQPPDWEQHDIIVTTQARVLSWGRIQWHKAIPILGAGGVVIGRNVPKDKRIVPQDVVIFCDDAQVDDFCMLADFDNKYVHTMKKQSEFATELGLSDEVYPRIDGKYIQVHEVDERRYFVRPLSYLFGHGMKDNQIIFSTTELVTQELIFRRYGGLKQKMVDDEGNTKTIGNVYRPKLMPDGKLIAGNITMLKTEVVRKKSDGLVPVILERVKKIWNHEIKYIADGQGCEYNHTNSKGQNIFKDSDMVIEISYSHELRILKLLHELGWGSEYKRALKIVLALDAIHQGIGRNSGYRFSDNHWDGSPETCQPDQERQCVVLLEPQLFDDVLKTMRYQHSNAVDLDKRNEYRIRRDEIGSELYTTLGWYIQNKTSYITERKGQLFLADVKEWLKSGSFGAHHPIARKSRLVLALTTLSERMGGRVNEFLLEMIQTVEEIPLAHEIGSPSQSNLQ